MGRFKDITGQRFGRLVAIEKSHQDKKDGWYWKCKCDCGKICYALVSKLRSGRIKSCGCLNSKKDMMGQRFGRLMVIGEANRSSAGQCLWRCQCDCGKEVTVVGQSLRCGNTKSCGCLQREIAKKRGIMFGKMPKTKYSHIVACARKNCHKLAVSPEYIGEIFDKQHERCALTGREITFGKKTHGNDCTASLDRIDSTKDYIEGNVQWVHKDINEWKSNWPNDEFIKMCCEVADYQRSKLHNLEKKHEQTTIIGK